MNLRSEGLVPGKLARATLLAALPVTAWSSSLQSQNRAPAATVVMQGSLAISQKVTKTLDSGTVHEWNLRLQDGEYVEMEIVAQGPVPSMRVIRPDRSTRSAFSSGVSSVHWIARMSGEWPIQIIPVGVQGTTYTLTWKQQRAATERDEQSVMADSLGEAAQRSAQGYRVAEAESLFLRSLAINEKVRGENDLLTAISLNDLAFFYVDLARYADAEPLYMRSLAIREKTLGPDHPAVGTILNNLGIFSARLGRFDQAEAMYERSLAIREKAGGPEHPTVAVALNNLGLLYETQGRFGEAEALHKRSLGIREKAFGPEHATVATSLNNLARVYGGQGRLDEAGRLFTRAVAIQEKQLGAEHIDVAAGLRNLGVTYEAQKRYDEAEALFKRALAIAEKVRGSEHPTTATRVWDLARVYHAQRRFAEAEPLYQRALAIREKTLGPEHPEVGEVLLGLALMKWARDKNADSVAPLVNRAIALVSRKQLIPRLAIGAYQLRARVRNGRGDLTGALTDLQQAIEISEEQRPQVGGGEETRAEFFARYANTYDLMVALQLEAGSIERAVEYSERGRARALLDQLAAGRIDLRESIPADVREPLERRETNARARMVEFQQRITGLSRRKDLTEAERARLTSTTDDSLRLAEREFRTVYDEIKNASPLWRDQITSGGQTVSLGTIQRRLVSSGGFLLMYHVGEEQSFLFLVPGVGQPEVFPLRVGADDARALGVPAGALTAKTLDLLIGGDVTAGAAGNARATAIAQQLSRSPAPNLNRAEATLSVQRLHALWKVLAPDTAWRRLQAASQVVIVPGRGLHALPFEALVVSVGRTQAQTRYWLDDGPAVRYVASASTLNTIEQRPAIRASAGSARPTVLTVSDPIFEPSQSGAQAAITQQSRKADSASQGEGLSRSSLPPGVGALARLPGTAAETEAIRRAFRDGQSTGSVVAFQGLQATESAVRAALLGKRYVHLATHGLVDESRGALFAALALTPPASASADDDGFLQLHEIYRLRLPELELAVLSACETNRGTTVAGEGVFALSRGFLAAGARRVIASQWVVEDRSTAELIGQYFHTIATAEAGGRVVDHAIALRDAKRAVRQRAGWEHPYFWAPFVLVGAR